MLGVDLSVWHMAHTTERQILDRQLLRKAGIGPLPRRPSILARFFRRDARTPAGALEAPPARLRQARGV